MVKVLSFASECVEGAHAHEESTAGDLDDGDDQGVGEGPQQGPQQGAQGQGADPEVEDLGQQGRHVRHHLGHIGPGNTDLFFKVNTFLAPFTEYKNKTNTIYHSPAGRLGQEESPGEFDEAVVDNREKQREEKENQFHPENLVEPYLKSNTGYWICNLDTFPPSSQKP